MHKGIPRILLYWVSFAVDLDIDKNQGVFLWQLCTQANPMCVVFCAMRIEHSEEVKEGMNFTMKPLISDLCDDADVATMLFTRKHIRLQRVDYTLKSLLSFTVNALEDVTDYVGSLRRGQAKKRAVRDPVVALVLATLYQSRY